MDSVVIVKYGTCPSWKQFFGMRSDCISGVYHWTFVCFACSWHFFWRKASFRITLTFLVKLSMIQLQIWSLLFYMPHILFFLCIFSYLLFLIRSIREQKIIAPVAHAGIMQYNKSKLNFRKIRFSPSKNYPPHLNFSNENFNFFNCKIISSFWLKQRVFEITLLLTE